MLRKNLKKNIYKIIVKFIKIQFTWNKKIKKKDKINSLPKNKKLYQKTKNKNHKNVEE